MKHKDAVAAKAALLAHHQTIQPPLAGPQMLGDGDQKAGSMVAVGVGTRDDGESRIAVRVGANTVPVHVKNWLKDHDPADVDVQTGVRYVGHGPGLVAGDPVRYESGSNGTLGAIVQHLLDPNQFFILGCGHVLGNCGSLPASLPHRIICDHSNVLNDGVSGYVADLHESIFEDFRMDAAVARIHSVATGWNARDLHPDIGISEPSPLSDEDRNGILRVCMVNKHGRVRAGRVGARDVDNAVIRYAYPGGSVSLTLGNLAEITGDEGAFSEPGDSGALVVDEAEGHRPFGMVIAGGKVKESNYSSLCHYFDELCAAFRVRLAP